VKAVLPLLAALTLGALGVWACRPPASPELAASPAVPVPAATMPPETAPATRRPPEPEPEPSWTVYQTETFRIGLPANWRTSKPDTGNAAGRMSTFRQDNPDLAGFLGGASPQTDLAFSAQDESGAAGGFRDNVNIRRAALDGRSAETLPEVAATIGAQYRQLGFDLLENATGLEIDGRPSARIAYTFSAADPDGSIHALSGMQWLVATPDDLWILTYTTTSDRFAALRPLFEESARSFSAR
jgi:hypothetical protein